MPTILKALRPTTRRCKKCKRFCIKDAIIICFLCVVTYNLFILHRVLLPDQTSLQEQFNTPKGQTFMLKQTHLQSAKSTVQTVLPEGQVHPLAHIVKANHGPPGTWKLVDWSDPFSPGEEEKYSCEMTTFVAAKSGRQSQMCVHTFHEVLTDYIKEHHNWRDCAVLVDWWRYKGMDDDNSLFIDIGSNIGGCVMEMLMSTKANIIAFEPHPMNVYNIKKTMSELGKEYQDRLLLFPVGVGNVQGSSRIYSAHDNMGNSQLGETKDRIKDWEAQEFREQLQFTVYIERIDFVLDAMNIDAIRLVKMDCQGYECNAVDGMGAVTDKIQYMKFEYDPRYLEAQGCKDLVPRVKEKGFDVYITLGGTRLNVELQGNPTWGKDFELVAVKSSGNKTVLPW